MLGTIRRNKIGSIAVKLDHLGKVQSAQVGCGPPSTKILL